MRRILVRGMARPIEWATSGALFVVVLAAAWAAAGDTLWIRWGKPAASELPAESKDVGDRPVKPEPTLKLPGILDPNDVRKGVQRLERTQSSNLSNMLHVLRLFGVAPADPDPAAMSRRGWLDGLLDYEKSRALFGDRATLIDTRDGIRCRDLERDASERQPEREAHTDQLLAMLGELGVPLSRPASTSSGPRLVKGLLTDSMANFDLKQQEIEWTALAYALYLPPRRSWTDKFNRTYSFDDLANELMNRGFERACAGTHLLHSLTVLYRADERSPVLSAETRRRLRDHLRRMASGLQETQAPDGSWKFDWYHHIDHRPHASEDGKTVENWRIVLVTGHHIEWLMLLPPDIRPPDEVFGRALGWLLKQLRGDPLEVMHANYCPYSHAAYVLKRLTGVEKESPSLATTRGAGSS